MIEWDRSAWTELEKSAPGRVALLPLGAVEEHGPHIAVGADWHAATAFGRRVADAADLVLLPVLPYGQVWSLGDYPGTLSVSDDTLVSIITDLSTGLRLADIKGLVMLSCHLGNMAAMKEAARRLADRAMPSLYLFYPGLTEASAPVRTTPEVAREIVHADEVETSIFLELVPEDVDMSKATAEWPSLPADVFSTPERWRPFCTTGVFGDPTGASAEKGRQILEVVERRAVELIGGWRERNHI